MRILLALVLWLTSFWAHERSPLMPEPNSLFLRVIDTGSGVATLTVVTEASAQDRHVMIYDMGYGSDDLLVLRELEHYLGQNPTIDLMIIGHSHPDHIGAANSVLKFWEVAKSVRTGWEPEETAENYWNYRRELEKSVDEKGTEDFVMGNGSPSIGEIWMLGDAQLEFLSGFSELPNDWSVGDPSGHFTHESNARNATSIVVRLDYDGRSILFPGDAVGRKDDGPWSQIIGTEKFLFENDGQRTIEADILIAPHHGADDASSLKFIEAVDPSWVIFSAGIRHEHPKFNTFRRYEHIGVPVNQILRTDRGDEKGRESEWSGNWDDSCRDGHGDDGISILIRMSGEIIVDQDPVDDPTLGC